MTMHTENRIYCIEIPVIDPGKARAFRSALFGWEFEKRGDDYMSLSDDIERDVRRVQELGATISQDVYSFPGGRRFRFVDPGGNEYAMWSAKLADNEQGA